MAISAEVEDEKAEKLSRNGIRSSRQRPPKAVVSGLVKPEIKKRLVEIAERDERTVAFIVGKMVELGLPLYEGRINPNEPTSHF